MCRAVIVDRIYEDAERIVPLDPGLTVHEVVARLAEQHPDLFAAQDPGHPLPAFPAGKRFRLPTLAVGTDPDGRPDYILQRTWHTRTLQPGETIAFVVVPRGGGGGSNAGKQIAGVIAMIALTIAAPYLIAGFAGAAGLGGVLGATASGLTLAGRLAAMGIVAGGAALMNALQPKADGPATTEQKVYSAAAANNTIQPGAIVPVPYGLNRWAPPFATRPYAEYENNEQFLYQVLCAGKGHQAIKRVLYGDTTVWTAEEGYSGAIDGLELEFREPGEGVTLFPAGVVIASEVAGQEIPNPTQWPPHGPFEANWLGPFVVNGAGETNRIDRIAIDFMMPEGIYSQGDAIGPFGADLMAQYREIDDSGDPVGSWTTFVGDGTGENGGKRYWGATREPQRFTEKVNVGKGRYEVRIAATYPFQPADSDAKNRTVWGALKGYLADFETPPGVTQIAVKIQAGEDLSELSANQFFVESVRKLPVWDPEEEEWSEPVETRSIAWAVADWLMNTDYGGGIAEGDIDLAWLAAYDGFWDERGDTFNGIFDREWMLLDGANAILRCGRSQVVRIGDRIGFTRYEAKDVKRAVFTPRTIVKGSFKRRWIFSDDTLPDSKYCKFLDAETWQYDEIKVEAPGYGSSRPVEETMFGFVDREHVWREGVTDCAINAYRDREFVSFTTEWDGKRLVRGDPVLAAHPLMANAFARISSVDSETITLDRDIAQALIHQWVDDASDWTGVNAGAPGEVADLGGSFVDDTAFGRRVAVRSGTATNPIRGKRTIEAPRDDTIIELQVRWRIVGDGEARIVARCISLDDDHEQISVVGEATDLLSGGNLRLTRFFFATPATAAGIGGVTAWAAAARHLRFGVNVNNGEGGAEARIAQIRPRAVHGLQDRIYIRGKRGREWGFCDVASIPDDRTIILDATHLAEVAAADGSIASILPGPRAEPAHLALFQDDARPFDGLVVSARPTGPNRVDVLLVRDDPRPYEADETGSAPPYLPPRKPPTPPDRPTVTGFSARLENGDFDVKLIGGWLPAPGARFYVAQVSYDEGDTWERVWRGREPSFTVPALRQAQRVRVRAVGKLPGPWATVDIGELAVPPPTPPPGSITPPSLDPDLNTILDQLRIERQAFIRAALDEKSDWLRRLSAVSTDVQAGVSVAEDRIMSAVVKRTAEASAVAIRLQQAIVEEGLARAEITDFVQAELASLDGQVTGLAAGMQTLVAQVSDINGTLTVLLEAGTILQGRIDDLESAQSGVLSGLELLKLRVDANEDGIILLAEKSTTLEGIVLDGTTGNSALGVAVESLNIEINHPVTGLKSVVASNKALLLAEINLIDNYLGRKHPLNQGSYGVRGLAGAYEATAAKVTEIEGQITIEAIRKSLLDSQYLQFQPIKVWKGRTAIQAKGAPINGAFSNAPNDTTRLTASGTSPSFRFNFEPGDYFGGAGNRTVRLVGRWVGAGHDYLGRLNYRTNSHGYAGNFRKDAPHPWGSGNAIPGQLVALSFDMTNVDGGGNPADWRQNTITGLQFSPSLSSSAIFDLWWIGWGSEVLSAYSAVVETDSAVTKKNDDGLTTMASSLKGLISETEYGYAEGLIAFETTSGPGGVLSRMLFRVRASDTDSFTQAAMALDTMAGGESRVVIAADRLILSNNNLVHQDPVFEIVGNVVYIKNAHIRKLTADNFEIDALSAPISGGITQNWRPPGQVQYGTWYNTPLSAQAKLTGQNRFYFVFLNVQGALTGLGSDTAYVSFRLMRGGSQVRLWNNVASQSGNNVLNFSADLYSLEHQPVGTPQTYTLQVRWTRSGGSGNVLASTNVGAGTRFIGFGNSR